MQCTQKPTFRNVYVPALSAVLAIAQGIFAADSVTVITPEQRAPIGLSTFYTKTIDADGIPIFASDRPEDAALVEARYLIVKMLQSAPRLKKSLVEAGLRVTVMAADEFTTDVPEHSRLTPKAYWDHRARGLGGTKDNPVVSCGEENLLHFPGDPYAGENILLHEFAHSVHLMGMAEVDPGFDARLREAYESAKKAGLWEGTYALTDRKEYFAEGSQSWFDCNAPPGKVHGDMRTREMLRKYDPPLAKLLEEVYGENSWRYESPIQRTDREQGAGTTWPDDKRFAWPAAASRRRN